MSRDDVFWNLTCERKKKFFLSEKRFLLPVKGRKIQTLLFIFLNNPMGYLLLSQVYKQGNGG